MTATPVPPQGGTLRYETGTASTQEVDGEVPSGLKEPLVEAGVAAADKVLSTGRMAELPPTDKSWARMTVSLPFLAADKIVTVHLIVDVASTPEAPTTSATRPAVPEESRADRRHKRRIAAARAWAEIARLWAEIAYPFIQRETIGTIAGGILLVLFGAFELVASCTDVTTSKTIDAAFLMIVAFFFGRITGRGGANTGGKSEEDQGDHEPPRPGD
jgi:hypothetical protein